MRQPLTEQSERFLVCDRPLHATVPAQGLSLGKPGGFALEVWGTSTLNHPTHMQPPS